MSSLQVDSLVTVRPGDDTSDLDDVDVRPSSAGEKMVFLFRLPVEGGDGALLTAILSRDNERLIEAPS